MDTMIIRNSHSVVRLTGLGAEPLHITLVGTTKHIARVLTDLEITYDGEIRVTVLKNSNETQRSTP